MNPTARYVLTLTLAGAACWPLMSEADDVPLPAEQAYDQVVAMNGGANVDESEAMKRMYSRYSLRVMLTEPNGQYNVADKLVVMRNGATVGTIPDAGPFVLMTLAPGRYTLEASFQGRTQRKEVNVGRSGTTLQWVTPVSDFSHTSDRDRGERVARVSAAHGG
ncbi:MAG: hypothetical protein HY021_03510 [Burkholderiales bacterium]|nr:hypothetical protein [Burkholderiales bacterium]